MKKIIRQLLFGAIYLMSIGACAQNQFNEFELVCENNAGTIRPLLKEIYKVSGLGFITKYYTLDNHVEVIPTGLIEICNNASSDVENIPICHFNGTDLYSSIYLRIIYDGSVFTQSYRDVNGNEVIPIGGTISIGHCPKNTFHVESGCRSVGTAAVNLADADNSQITHIIILDKNGNRDTINNGGLFAAGWSPNLISIVANTEGLNLCTSGSWSLAGNIISVDGYITNYDSLLISDPPQSFAFERSNISLQQVEIIKELDQFGSVVNTKAYSTDGTIEYKICEINVGNCPCQVRGENLMYEATDTVRYASNFLNNLSVVAMDGSVIVNAVTTKDTTSFTYVAGSPVAGFIATHPNDCQFLQTFYEIIPVGRAWISIIK